MIQIISGVVMFTIVVLFLVVVILLARAKLVASGPAEMVGGLEAGPTQEVPEDVRRRLAEIGYTEEVGETHE